jgi:UDPglucose 6-dehydrogenase
VRKLPPELDGRFQLHASAGEALQNADALVVATEWPEYRGLAADELCSRMKEPNVIDPNGFLDKSIGADARIRYFAVGRSHNES